MVGSGTPPGAISCMRRLPCEATRMVTWMEPSRSGFFGSVVTVPVQVPARPFKASNATDPFDGGRFASDRCATSFAKVGALDVSAIASVTVISLMRLSGSEWSVIRSVSPSANPARSGRDAGAR